MAYRGALPIFTTLTCGNGSGAKAPIAAQGAGAPTNGFLNVPSADGFGFRGKLRAATGNSGTVSIECQIPDSASPSVNQTYTAVLAAGEESAQLEDVDLFLLKVYGSAAGQKLHVMGSH